MNQWYVQFVLLSILVVFASCLRIHGGGLSLTVSKEGEKLIADDFTYVLESKTKRPCILANMSIEITVPYTKKDKSETKVLKVPDNATIVGTCSSIISDMKMIWKEGEKGTNNTVTFIFVNDHTDFSIFSIHLNIYLDKKNFVDSTEEWHNSTSEVDLRLFAASATNGIHTCSEGVEKKIGSATVTIKNVALIAFNSGNYVSSPKETTCSDKDNAKTFPYVLKNSRTRKICALARMSICLIVPYKTVDSKLKNATLSVPSDATVVGRCESSTVSEMKLTWPAVRREESASDSTENSITFSFTRNGKSSFARHMTINVFKDEKHFPDDMDKGDTLTASTRSEQKLFLAPADNGIYSCANATELNLNNKIHVIIKDVLLVAFDGETNFGSKKDKNKMSREDTDFNLGLFSAAVRNGIYNCTSFVQQVKAGSIHINVSDVTFVAFNTEKDLNSKEVAAYPEQSDTSSTSSTSSTTETTESSTLSTESTTSSTSSTTETTESSTLSTESTISPTNLTTQLIPTPEPDPSLERYHYIVVNPKTHVACIVANMSISMKIPYKKKDSETAATVLKVPATAKSSGKCEDTSQTMKLTWTLEHAKDDATYKSEENEVTLTFKKDESKYSLRSISLNVYMDEKHFPDAADKKCEVSTDELDTFSATLANLYKCVPDTLVKAKDVGITISDVALIAFNTEKSVASRTVENCVTPTTSNVGAIVGGIIGGVIVCIALGMLIYRKRRIGRY